MIYTGQSLIALDYTACILKWSPSPDDDVAGYNVYMQEGKKGTPQKMNGTLITTTEWTSPPLRRDLTYYFHLTATDFSGNTSVNSPTYTYRPDPSLLDSNVVVVDIHRQLILKNKEMRTDILNEPNHLLRFDIGVTI